MHIREPRDFAAVKSKRRKRYQLKRASHLVWVACLVLVGLVIAAYGAYARPYPAVAAKTITPAVAADQVALSWPAVGQAAIGVQGQGVMAATNAQQPVPAASTAKVMTALAVLKKYPLKLGEQGPKIPITEADITRYNNYVAQDGSVVKVEIGEQITEYQALQAILLPSANNISDTLAVWAYGSMAQYHVAANQLAQNLGMTQSVFAGDASGLLPETKSTAHDLVLLGQEALNNPVLKQIVAQQTADIPVAGTVSNVNVFLGRGGIIGIKTGNTEQAGGCYLFAAERTLADGQKVTSVGAVMAAPNLGRAMTSSLPLLDSFYQGFTNVNVVPKGTVVGHYDAAWDKTSVTAVTAQDTKVLNWRGSKATVKVQLTSLSAPQAAGVQAGTISAQSNYGKTTTPVVLSTPLSAPNWRWRIVRH